MGVKDILKRVFTKEKKLVICGLEFKISIEADVALSDHTSPSNIFIIKK